MAVLYHCGKGQFGCFVFGKLDSWKVRITRLFFLSTQLCELIFMLVTLKCPQFFSCPLACCRWTGLWDTVISTLCPSSLKITGLVWAFSLGQLPSPFRSGSRLINPLDLEGQKSGSAGGAENESRGLWKDLWVHPGAFGFHLETV